VTVFAWLSNHSKTFFFVVGLAFILSGLVLTQIDVGEEQFVQIRPQIAVTVAPSTAVGLLFVGIGLVS
jgi:hypothetical protein